MTSEQIANLKGRLDERCVDGEGINVTREDVERLLDEREALLKALKMLAPDGGKYVPPFGTGALELRIKLTREDWRQVQDAIAKAESP